MIILITWNHGSHQVRERRLKQTSPHYMLLSFLLILKLNQKKSKTEFFNSIFVLKSSIEINFKLEYINDLWLHISPEHCTALYETHISRSSGPHHPLKNFIESKMHLQTPTSLKQKLHPRLSMHSLFWLAWSFYQKTLLFISSLDSAFSPSISRISFRAV